MRFRTISGLCALVFGVGALTSVQTFANPYFYPAVRYMSPQSASLGGITLPIDDEVGNSLFNNPAALARNPFFRAEYLNLNLDLNSNALGSLTSLPSFPSLGSYTSKLNSDPNQVYSGGFGNLTAVSWGGLAFGLLIQERVRAYSDGSNAHYETFSHLIPALGYGFSLARGVVRVGYSLQWVSQASGVSQSVSDSSAAYLSGLSEGKGFSHTASVNFVFPFTYIPTFSLLARNIGGLRFTSGALLKRAKSPTGTPPDQEMSLDAAFNFMVRISGPVKSNWYIQYRDLSNTAGMSLLERLSAGIDFSISSPVTLRVGFNNSQFNFGIGYRSESSEINLAYYKDPSTFSNLSAFETRYALQYKVLFQDRNTRDREAEQKIR